MTEDESKNAESSNGAAQEEDDEDDYMNMIIAEPSKPREKETYTQRRQRIQRESEARSRTKSKAEVAAEEAAERENALSKSMLEAPSSANSKGLKMMAKMGISSTTRRKRDRRMRYDLQQSLSRLPTYDDEDEDKDDKRALGKDRIQHTIVEDLEEEDPELDAFTLLEPAERLQKLVEHLRSEYNYCFFCKYTYPDDSMDGCPGLMEEDHD
ncbi:c4dbfed9-593e-4bc1-9674-c5fd152451c0 [Sclerotinia trifoliorum]|uniref:C4dbfed9-593e-4bc1-9674-c5fd152451c0 n=1 Tax=Sclerotinia trifoliorum TaxID=28548 RepID=A0A8H2ZRS1_9HELO|nr:c4dbfed9-593e-4bc1-9674-c5fd152451c0 [Sclerotinia trifoliorum]